MALHFKKVSKNSIIYRCPTCVNFRYKGKCATLENIFTELVPNLKLYKVSVQNSINFPRYFQWKLQLGQPVYKRLHRHAINKFLPNVQRATQTFISHSQLCYNYWKLTSEDKQPLGESGSNLVSSCASGATKGGICILSSKKRRWEAGESGTGEGPSLAGRRGIAFPRLWCWRCSWLRKQPVPVCAGFRPLAESPSVLFPSACDRLCPVWELK